MRARTIMNTVACVTMGQDRKGRRCIGNRDRRNSSLCNLTVHLDASAKVGSAQQCLSSTNDVGERSKSILEVAVGNIAHLCLLRSSSRMKKRWHQIYRGVASVSSGTSYELGSRLQEV